MGRRLGPALGVAACFGVGFSAGILDSGGGAGTERDERGVSLAERRVVSALAAPPGADEEVHGLFARLKDAGREDYLRALERLPEKDDDSPVARSRRLALAIRWVLEDAVGGAEFLSTEAKDGPHAAFTKSFLAVWAKQDRAAAEAFAARLKAEENPWADSLLAACGGVRAAEDPEGFLRERKWSATSFLEGLRNLARNNPAKAAAFLAEETDTVLRLNGAEILASEWVKSDPAAAKAWALGLDRAERDSAFAAVIKVLAERDFPAALAGCAEMESMGSLPSAWKIAYALARRDPGEALRWLEAGLKLNALGSVEPFLPRDPAAFRALIETLGPGMFRDAVANRFGVDFGGDPATLFGQLAALRDDAATAAMLQNGVRGWMATDPGAARRALLDLPEAPRARAAAVVLEEFLGSFASAGEAVDFARAAGVEALSVGFAAWAGGRGDASEAAGFLAALPGEAGTRALPALVSGWAARAPEEAAAWSATLGDEALRARLAGPLVREWVGRDAYAASEWAASLGEGAEREAAANRLARSLVGEEPSSAFAWAVTLRDPAEREWLARDAYRGWARRAPGEAAAALRAADIPEALRASLLATP